MLTIVGQHIAFSIFFLFFYNTPKCAARTCIIYHSELFRWEGREIAVGISLPRAYLLQKVWSTWLTRFLREKGRAHRLLGQECVQADPSPPSSLQPPPSHTCESHLPSLCGSPMLAAASLGTMGQVCHVTFSQVDWADADWCPVTLRKLLNLPGAGSVLS